MSYIINKTDGTVLTEVVDGTVDQTATDLTLVGKNASTYGEFLNENFVHILENFASTSAPNHPQTGQLWYDTGEARLKVYDGSGFKVSGGTIVANSVPTTIVQGDIWIDSSRQQLYFNDGVSTILAGPGYTAQQGITGLQSVDVTDSNNLTQTVSLLWIGGSILGLFSKTEFTPLVTIPQFEGTVKVGFNASTWPGVKFNVPCTQADTLVASDGSLKTPDSFLSKTDDTVAYGTMSILNSTPLILGPGGLDGSTEIKVSNGAFKLNSNSSGQNFEINLLNSNGIKPSIHINAISEYVGLYTSTPTAMLDVNGDVRIRGALTVEGDITSINQTNINIEDKLINLGKTSLPTNITANGGGILLEGGLDGDKTLTWADSTAAWTSSENVNLAVGKGYYVNSFQVLTQTQLGITVTSAPGLTSIGTLTSLAVANLTVNGSTISYYSAGGGDGDITLVPAGAGVVNVSSSIISNVLDPVAATDAANLQTVERYVQTAPMGLSADTSAYAGPTLNALIILNILDKIYPPAEYQDGALCRLWCIDTETAKEFEVVSGAWAFQGNI